MKRLALVLSLLAGAAAAAPPDISKRPVGRPGSTAGGPVSLGQSGAITVPETQSRSAAVVASAQATSQSVRPKKRPQQIRRIARENERMRRAGAVCGDVDIQGEAIGSVPGRIAGCGIGNAVRVRAVSDIRLSQVAVMDCPTAKALKTWIDDTAKPALRRKGGGLAALRVAAHYACRTRNNLPGGRISEHGKGRAIDISAVKLRDGSTITVLRGWTAAATSKEMRQLHKGACGPFGTVLGPDSDRFHKDHFHFDTARYRSGPYCR